MDINKLKKVLNWKKINNIYKECFPSKKGRFAKKTDLSLGLILLKHLYRKPDRTLVEELHLNNVYIHFCGLSHDEVAVANREGKKTIDHSTLVKIRQRLGAERIQKILCTFTTELINKKIINDKILFTDATSLEKNIIYPTGIGLLSRVIEEAAVVARKVRYKISLAIPHKKDRIRVMTTDEKKLSDKKSAIEAKISEGKRMCGLDRSLYNGFTGDRIWVVLSVMALNIRKLLRDIEKSPELINI